MPDFYQGTEFWDFSLVDPDNRRPVDFAARAAALSATCTPNWGQLVQQWPNGHLKLAWTRHLLRLRAESINVFTHGDYEPLEVRGPHRDHVIAYVRRHRGEAVVVAVAKCFAPFTQGGRFWPRAEAFDGIIDLDGWAIEGGARHIALSELFTHLPAAVRRARADAARLPRKRKPKSS